MSSAATSTVLDEIARHARRAVDAASIANIEAKMGNVETGRKHAQVARDASRSVLAVAIEAGAANPSGASALPVDVPLHLLDTPASRRLLSLLRDAAEAGAAVDRERGWVQDGEPCGWGEQLAGLALQFGVEVEGPQGRE